MEKNNYFIIRKAEPLEFHHEVSINDSLILYLLGDHLGKYIHVRYRGVPFWRSLDEQKGRLFFQILNFGTLGTESTSEATLSIHIMNESILLCPVGKPTTYLLNTAEFEIIG